MTLVGDAELDEGSNHEAIAFAGAVGLDHLTTVVDRQPLVDPRLAGRHRRRFEVEGWETRTVYGRDHDALYEAFTTPHPGRPLAVVAGVEPKDDGSRMRETLRGPPDGAAGRRTRTSAVVLAEIGGRTHRRRGRTPTA